MMYKQCTVTVCPLWAPTTSTAVMKKTNFTHFIQKTPLNILPINSFRWDHHGRFCPDSSGQQVEQPFLMASLPPVPVGNVPHLRQPT